MTRLFKFIIPYRKTLILVVVLLFLQTLGTLYIPTLTADIVNNGIVYGDIPYIIRTGGIMLLFAVLVLGHSLVRHWPGYPKRAVQKSPAFFNQRF